MGPRVRVETVEGSNLTMAGKRVGRTLEGEYSCWTCLGARRVSSAVCRVWEWEPGRGGDKETGREVLGLLGKSSSTVAVPGEAQGDGGGDKLAVKGFLRMFSRDGSRSPGRVFSGEEAGMTEETVVTTSLHVPGAADSRMNGDQDSAIEF